MFYHGRMAVSAVCSGPQYHLRTDVQKLDAQAESPERMATLARLFSRDICMLRWPPRLASPPEWNERTNASQSVKSPSDFGLSLRPDFPLGRCIRPSVRPSVRHPDPRITSITSPDCKSFPSSIYLANNLSSEDHNSEGNAASISGFCSDFSFCNLFLFRSLLFHATPV